RPQDLTDGQDEQKLALELVDAFDQIPRPSAERRGSSLIGVRRGLDYLSDFVDEEARRRGARAADDDVRGNEVRRERVHLEALAEVDGRDDAAAQVDYAPNRRRRE